MHYVPRFHGRTAPYLIFFALPSFTSPGAGFLEISADVHWSVSERTLVPKPHGYYFVTRGTLLSVSHMLIRTLITCRDCGRGACTDGSVRGSVRGTFGTVPRSKGALGIPPCHGCLTTCIPAGLVPHRTANETNYQVAVDCC